MDKKDELAIEPIVGEDPVQMPSGEGVVAICSGCLNDDKCYAYGHRRNGLFCDSESGGFIEQTIPGGVCDNSFECDSNICLDSERVSGNFLRKIANWFKKFFG